MKMTCIVFVNPAGLHCALLAGNLQDYCLKMILPDKKNYIKHVIFF